MPFATCRVLIRAIVAMIMVNKKILLQPKHSVRVPPKKGPSVVPRYTQATLMPRAYPRCSLWIWTAIMAIEVA